MIYMFLAEGFEEIEALCPLDLMRRAGLSVTTVGIGGEYITGAHAITIRADITDRDFYAHSAQNETEMVFLPGGMPGTLNLGESEVVGDAIRSAYEDGKYIAAICAAPSILGKMGLLLGKEAICYPGFEDTLVGARISEEPVVLDGRIATAKGMGVALEFGLLAVSLLCGEETARDLRSAVIADR
jgi:4-methyl-5(b-hydroxyethyl)-thiazole monophosphate biosynthesis